MKYLKNELLFKITIAQNVSVQNKNMTGFDNCSKKGVRFHVRGHKLRHTSCKR